MKRSNELKKLLAAFGFLTILPVPGSSNCTTETLCASGGFFPLVGIVIGSAMGALAWLGVMVLPQQVAGLFVVVAMWAVSGGLHTDGLSDTADGFLSGRPRDRVLEIMKDSQIGAMGAVAIVVAILAKVICLGAVDAAIFWRAAALAPIAGRCAMLIGMVVLPPANPGSGLGAMFLTRRKWYEAVFAAIVAGVCGYALLGWAGAAAAGAAIVVVLLFCIKCYRKIGGASGDTMGASCELAEITVLLAATVEFFASFTAGAWL